MRRLFLPLLLLLGLVAAATGLESFTAFGRAYIRNTLMSGAPFPTPMRIAYSRERQSISAAVDVKTFGEFWGTNSKERNGLAWVSGLELYQMQNALKLHGFVSYMCETAGQHPKWSEMTAFEKTRNGAARNITNEEVVQWFEESINGDLVNHNYFFRAIEAAQRIVVPKHLLAEILQQVDMYKKQTHDGQPAPPGSGAHKYVNVTGERGVVFKQYMFKVLSDKQKNYEKTNWKLAQIHTNRRNPHSGVFSSAWRPVGTVTVTVSDTYMLKEFAYYKTVQEDVRGPAKNPTDDNGSDLIVRFVLDRYLNIN